MYTEEKAKRKWCPMARVPLDQSATSVNRLDNVRGTYDFTTCMASDCMMWRWDADSPESLGDAREGFCGLTGGIHGR